MNSKLEDFIRDHYGDIDCAIAAVDLIEEKYQRLVGMMNNLSPTQFSDCIRYMDHAVNGWREFVESNRYRKAVQEIKREIKKLREEESTYFTLQKMYRGMLKERLEKLKELQVDLSHLKNGGGVYV